MSDPHARAAAAYASTGKIAPSQRQLEAHALLKAASQLESARDRWTPQLDGDLDEALLFNRKLWTVFAAEAADGRDRLPDDLRNGIGSLAVFVFKRTFELLASPEPNRIDVLIEINRNLAAGLMARPAASDPIGMAPRAGPATGIGSSA